MEYEKKTEQINVKITPTLKKDLKDTAQKYHWTLSQTAYMILEQFYKDQKDIRL